MNVILGTGGVGLAVMDELAERRLLPITLVNRSGKIAEPLPEGVQVMAADLTDPEQVRKVAGAAKTVYLCATPPYTSWTSQFLPLIHGIIGGLSGSDARLVYADNLYMYKHLELLHEKLPEAATTRKGRVRAEAAQLLRAAPFAVAVGRAPDYYGPRGGASSQFGDLFFKAALAGKPVTLFGNPDLPHTFIYLRDFARALVTLGEHDVAFGQTWHLPSAETTTTQRLVELFVEALGKPIKVRAFSPSTVKLLSIFSPILREFNEMMYQWTQPFIVKDDKFRNAFGEHTTPHREAVSATVGHYSQD